MPRISFNYSDASHLYELSLQNYQKGCYSCEVIKKRLEKFLGQKEVRRTKRIIKNNPY